MLGMSSSLRIRFGGYILGGGNTGVCGLLRLVKQTVRVHVFK